MSLNNGRNPVLPAGFASRAAREDDIEVIVDLLNDFWEPLLGMRKITVDDAFRDHWGHVERPEEEGSKRFQHGVENDPDFDPSLWFLAMDGDEVAAVVLCQPKTGDDPNMGFVDVLAVRRPWRRKGPGLALLHLSFGEF
jgi:hypothetical protein